MLLATAGAQAADKHSGTFTLFQHDTSQEQLDFGAPGLSVGDQYAFGGDIFDHEGGTKLGRSAGHCVSTSLTEMLCSASIGTGKGQITIEGLIDNFTFFTSNPVDFAITGGTGPYLRARGKVTILILPDVPGGTDALVTVDLKK